MKNLAKFMSIASFTVAFVFFIVAKGGIGDIDAPKNFLKK